MNSLEEALKDLPKEIQLPLYKALTIVKEESRELIAKEEIKKVWEAISDLAEAQKRTEQRITELAEAQKRTEQRVNELAEAQRKTEERVSKLEEKMAELAEAQRKTEERVSKLEEKMAELAEAQRKTEEEVRALTREMRDMRKDFGGFQRTISYAFENEAYKKLPKYLKEKHNIEVLERIARMDIDGLEINFFAKAKKDGKEYCLVGEVQMKLDEKEESLKRKRRQKDIFEELQEKADIVREEYGKDVIRILVCHFATKGFLKLAKEEDVIVIQSFDLE